MLVLYKLGFFCENECPPKIVQGGFKDIKIKLVFILWGPIKHKILSIVLKMANYTIISLILIELIICTSQLSVNTLSWSQNLIIEKIFSSFNDKVSIASRLLIVKLHLLLPSSVLA